jgi:hypothetical protein
MSTRVRNEPKFVSFFKKCRLLSKKSLNVREKTFRKRLVRVSNTTSSANAAAGA